MPLYFILSVVNYKDSSFFFSVHHYPKPQEGDSYSEKICPLLFVFVEYWNETVLKRERAGIFFLKIIRVEGRITKTATFCLTLDLYLTHLYPYLY